MLHKNSINIYLDESSIDNPKNYYMVIGGIFLRRDLKPSIIQEVKKLKENFRFGSEIKRNGVSKKYLLFYKALIDLFFQYDDNFQFHCIVVDKRTVRMNLYHQGDKELAFYKFIYHFLKQKVNNNTSYYIYLDQKQRRIKDRVDHLDNYLSEHCSLYNKNTTIKHLQEYNSSNQILIQLADLLIGAVGYKKNSFNGSSTKNEICSYIASKLGQDSLDICSTKRDTKYNIFCIRLS